MTSKCICPYVCVKCETEKANARAAEAQRMIKEQSERRKNSPFSLFLPDNMTIDFETFSKNFVAPVKGIYNISGETVYMDGNLITDKDGKKCSIDDIIQRAAKAMANVQDDLAMKAFRTERPMRLNKAFPTLDTHNPSDRVGTIKSISVGYDVGKAKDYFGRNPKIIIEDDVELLSKKLVK